MEVAPKLYMLALLLWGCAENGKQPLQEDGSQQPRRLEDAAAGYDAAAADGGVAADAAADGGAENAAADSGTPSSIKPEDHEEIPLDTAPLCDGSEARR